MKNPSFLLQTVALVAATSLLSNCATMIAGKTQTVTINSQPAGAKVSVDGSSAGTTPTTAALSRSSSHRVEITLPGYRPYSVVLEQSFNYWVIADIFLTGFIGLIVDSSTGACYVLSPGEIDATFQGGKLSGIKAHDGVYIATVLKPEPGWRKIGQLTKS